MRLGRRTSRSGWAKPFVSLATLTMLTMLMLLGTVTAAAAVTSLNLSVSAASAIPSPSSASVPLDTPCPPDPAPVSQADVIVGLRDATERGLLWKLTRDGHSSYLYGTIHVARRDWMFPGPHVMAAWTASDTVALELDTTDADTLARLSGVVRRPPAYPALPAALAERLRARAAAECLPMAMLDGLRHEMAAITVDVMAARRLGLYTDYGIDEFIAHFSHAQGKPVRALETPEMQGKLLVSDDPAETARSVGDVLDELEDGESAHVVDRMAADWERGDLGDFDAYPAWCDCMDSARQRAEFEELVNDRNPAMADRVAQWHAQGHSLFVAVGSLHMVGAQGLPALLQARGFTVERVSPAGAAH